MRKRLAVSLVVSLPLMGCPLVGHQSGAARAQEAATELNMNSRFGRMELAAEKVSQKGRQSFFDHRRTWGGKIRIADYELAGLKMQGEDDAEITVRVAWYRIDEGDLHTTTLRQKWHDYKGDWKLVDEGHADGDVGLIGEPVVAPPAATGPRNAQFPTIHLGTTTNTPSRENASE